MNDAILEAMQFVPGPIRQRGRWWIPDGLTSMLICGHSPIMDDSLGELKNHLNFCKQASGKVLVAGLGLGCVVRGLLAAGKVTHIDVVENSNDVIDLCGHSVADNRVTIHRMDATVELPEGEWDFAWWDLEGEGKDTNYFSPIHDELMERYKGRIKQQMKYRPN